MSELIKRSQGPCLYLSLNRPKVHNALNLNLINALQREFSTLIESPELYDLVILDGVGPSFCAGADVREMKNLLSQIAQGTAKYSEAQYMNQSYGALLELAQSLPQTVISIAKGSILGGGLGLIAISDLVLCHAQTLFALPEAKLGLIPAQVAPFVMKRIGLSATRKLALCGTMLTAEQALNLNLVDQLYIDDHDLDVMLEKYKRAIARLAPQARAQTKALLMKLDQQMMLSQNPSKMHLDANGSVSNVEKAALSFVESLKSDEFKYGSQALFNGTQPVWTQRWHFDKDQASEKTIQNHIDAKLNTQKP